MRYVRARNQRQYVINPPVLFLCKEILDFFDAQGVELRKYPITFDSWYGSRKLIDILREFVLRRVLIHAKNNYVMTIGDKTDKLSVT